MLLTRRLSRKDRMDMHKIAPLTPRGRAEMVRRRIAARYDKNADNFVAELCLAALICYQI